MGSVLPHVMFKYALGIFLASRNIKVLIILVQIERMVQIFLSCIFISREMDLLNFFADLIFTLRPWQGYNLPNGNGIYI